MAKKTPKAHSFEDGGGLVTGTHDVAAAVAIMQQHSCDLSCNYGGYEHIPARCMDTEWVTAEDAELETGRFIPNGDGWTWRKGYELGVPGVTKAVVWHV